MCVSVCVKGSVCVCVCVCVKEGFEKGDQRVVKRLHIPYPKAMVINWQNVWS